MKHVVLSTNASGAQQTDEFSSLEAALEQVEHLRNDGDVSDVRVLREVPIEVKTYYKVVALADADGSDSESTTATLEVAVSDEPSVDEDEDETSPESFVASEEPTDEPSPYSESASVSPIDAMEPPAPPTERLHVDAPSGAAVFSPPPVVSHPTPEDDGQGGELDTVAAERRTSLFGRG